MHKILVIGSTLVVAAAAVAQSTSAPAGFTYNVNTGATTRGPQGAGRVQLLSRFDSEDYRGFGGAGAASNEVLGVQFLMQDQYALTGSQEQYDVRVYGEDLTTPHPSYPNFTPSQPVGTNELVHLGPFTSPVGGTVADPRQAWIVALAFATPIQLPNAQDVFVGVEFQVAAAANTARTPATWPNDGLSLHTSLGASGISQIYDARGPGAISAGTTANSYLLVHDVANNVYAYSTGPHQGQVDFLVPSNLGRGVVTAITNQTTYPGSNTATGTASFFSALHPDARAVPQNAGRADNVGYAYFGAPAGQLVFYLVDFNFAATSTPLASLLPGSTGVACLNPATCIVMSFRVASGSGTDYYQFPLSASARQLIAGITMTMQGMAFDGATGLLTGAPCGAVKF